jgi:hypothetical protein
MFALGTGRKKDGRGRKEVNSVAKSKAVDIIVDFLNQNPSEKYKLKDLYEEYNNNLWSSEATFTTSVAKKLEERKIYVNRAHRRGTYVSISPIVFSKTTVKNFNEIEKISDNDESEPDDNPEDYPPHPLEETDDDEY